VSHISFSIIHYTSFIIHRGNKLLTALYIGDHSGDTLSVRAGWALTRMVQRGAYRQVTHTEMILDEMADGSVLIGSSSLRDGGVRIKKAKLNPAHWLIVDVPSWDIGQSFNWFIKHKGDKYDLWGALATVLPSSQYYDRWYCNEACAASVGIVEPQLFGPAQYAAISMSLGRDVTAEFFKGRL
jgi:hypothetical protein